MTTRIVSTAKAFEILTDPDEIKSYLKTRMLAAFSKRMILKDSQWITVGIHPCYNSFDGFRAKEWFQLRDLALKDGLEDTGEDAHTKVINKVSWKDEEGIYALTYSTMNVFAGHGMQRTKHSFGWSFAPSIAK